MRLKKSVFVISVSSLVVLLVAVLILQLARGSQLIGFYEPPAGGTVDGAHPLAPGKLAVLTTTSDDSYNLAVFDLQSRTFTDTFNFVPAAANYIRTAFASAVQSPRIVLGFDFVGVAAVGNLATGVLELEADYYGPRCIAVGMVGAHEVALIFGNLSPSMVVLDLDGPSNLGEIQLPPSYLASSEWDSERSADYRNSFINRGQLVFSSPTSTAFFPRGHLGLIHWIQLDLASGFDYQMGAIDVGGNPRLLTLSENGQILYSLDDQNNVLKVIDLSTLSVVDTIDIPSGSVVWRMIEAQGMVFLLQHLDAPWEFYLTRINPVTHETVPSEAEEGLPSGPEFYNGSLYVLQNKRDSEAADLLEFDASTLALTSELSLGETAEFLVIDQSLGYGAASTFSYEGEPVGRLILMSL